VVKVMLLGATGGTGTLVVGPALEAGHELVCLVRTPSKLTTTHERLTVVQGDVLDTKGLTAAMAGCDVVVSTIGTSSPTAVTSLYSTSATAICTAMKAAGVPRLISVSSAGLMYDANAPAFWNYVLRPASWRMYADMTEMELRIVESGLDYTLARPPRLLDGPGGHELVVELGVPVRGTAEVDRADLATWLVQEIAEARWVNRRPMIYTIR
jgi:putative NADH-flavin reductase